MAFSASNIITANNKTEKQPDPNDLSTQDIELLLALLKTSTFKGEQLEFLYNLVVKLQNQYISKSK